MNGEEENVIVLRGDDHRVTDEVADVPVLREDGSDEATLPDHARLNADGTVTLPLLFPVTLEFRKGSAGDVITEQYDEFTMHRLNGADMRAISAAGAGGMAHVAIARSARVSPAKMNIAFDRMDGADINAAGQVVSFFLSAGRRTGR